MTYVSLVDLSKSCSYSGSAQYDREYVLNKYPAISRRYKVHHIQDVSLNAQILHQVVSLTIHKSFYGRDVLLPMHLHNCDRDNSIHLPRAPGRIPSTCRLVRRSTCERVAPHLTRSLPDESVPHAHSTRFVQA